MSIRRVKANDGEFKWLVRAYEAGRGSRRISKTFERKADAEAFLIKFKSENLERANSPFKTCTFKDRIFSKEAELWLNDGELRFSKSHFVRVSGVIKELLVLYGDWGIEKFTPEFLTKYQQTEKAKGLENATVNRKTEVFTSILNFSVRQRRIPFSPANGFRKLKKSESEMLFWSKDEAESFLSCMAGIYPSDSSSRWIYVAYLVALNTGMRAGEIWGLKPIDLCDSGSRIIVRRQFNRVTKSFTETKGKKVRYVPCNAELRFELLTLISKNKVGKDETIFLNENRNPICDDNFSDRQFGKDIKTWGGRRIRFHDLRHTAATFLIGNGVDIKTVKEICGHKDISTTMNYAHLIPGSIEKVAKSFSISAKKITEALIIPWTNRR